MTYMLRGALIVGIVLVALGCAGDAGDGGGGSGGGDGLDGTFLFACDNPAGTNLAAPVHGCADYFVNSMGAAARAPLEQSCTINGGTVRDEPCVDAGKVGACLIRTPGTEAFGLYSLDWLYAPSDAAEVQDSCLDGGYDFVQPDGTVVSNADGGTDSGATAASGTGGSDGGGTNAGGTGGSDGGDTNAGGTGGSGQDASATGITATVSTACASCLNACDLEAASLCDDACWDLLRCWAQNCAEEFEVNLTSCVISHCTPFLSANNSVTAPLMDCATMTCTIECQPDLAAGAPDAG